MKIIIIKLSLILYCVTLHQNSSAQTGVPFLRTPDSRFENLKGYAFKPNYVMVDDFEGGQLRMHYIDEGPKDGPTLILLHGNPSWTYIFREIIPLLNSAGYRTIAVDYIGMGRSDKPTKWEDYTYDRHVRWVKQWFDHINSSLNLKQVSIVGHDYGTPIGIRLMSEYYPTRFDAFIDINASLPDGSYISPTHLNWRQFVRDNPDVPIGHIISSQVNPALSADEINAYYAPYPTIEYKMAMRTFPEMVPESPTWPEAIANLAAWKYLEKFTKPFMTIFGSFDGVGIPSARMEFIDRVPGAYGQPHFQLDVSHYAPEDRPDDVANAIINFLKDVYDETKYVEYTKVSFENGFDGFMDGGINCTHSVDLKSIQLKGNLGQESSTTKNLGSTIKEIEFIKVAFRYITNQLVNGDQLLVEMGNGSTWQTVMALKVGADFANGAEDYGFTKISNFDIDFKNFTTIRFRSASNNSQGVINLLDVGLYYQDKIITSIISKEQPLVSVYPNPCTNIIYVTSDSEWSKNNYRLINSLGISISSGLMTSNPFPINMEPFAPGPYWITINSGTENQTRLILKK